MTSSDSSDCVAGQRTTVPLWFSCAALIKSTSASVASLMFLSRGVSVGAAYSSCRGVMWIMSRQIVL